MDIYGNEPSTEEGEYFRANIFSWAPILGMIQTAVQFANLSVDTSGWQFNDGHGLKTQAECDALADAMQVLLQGTESPVLHAEHLDVTKALTKVLGTDIEPQAQVSRERIAHFITFLRGCGGFKIC